MKYYIKSGSLYRIKDEQSMTRIVTVKDPAFTTKKCLEAENKEFYTDIRLHNTAGNLNDSEYVLYDKSKNCIAAAKPKFDPDIHDWSVTQVLHVNCASVDIKGIPYELHMLNSQNYRLTRHDSTIAVEIIQNGISGGWTVTIEKENEFEPVILLGVFFFCRYLEKENECVFI
ncbi:hypothetical protein [Clostridium sp. Marseille-P2415]|uniref:hypothetical protein n=1 Tax=Clostridium sp. Marseille-P2415 TaxID=1805471 RepID=UPI000988459F|nr:hypothetical protein [Clostridium sp. Marseille-P2415]